MSIPPDVKMLVAWLLLVLLSFGVGWGFGYQHRVEVEADIAASRFEAGGYPETVNEDAEPYDPPPWLGWIFIIDLLLLIAIVCWAVMT